MALLSPRAGLADEHQTLVDQLDEVVDPDPIAGVFQVFGELVGGRPDHRQPLTANFVNERRLSLGEAIGDSLDDLRFRPVMDPFALPVPVVLAGVRRHGAVALDPVLAAEGPDADIGGRVLTLQDGVVMLADCH